MHNIKFLQDHKRVSSFQIIISGMRASGRCGLQEEDAHERGRLELRKQQQLQKPIIIIINNLSININNTRKKVSYQEGYKYRGKIIDQKLLKNGKDTSKVAVIKIVEIQGLFIKYRDWFAVSSTVRWMGVRPVGWVEGSPTTRAHFSSIA